eukprot:sb/3469581/
MHCNVRHVTVITPRIQKYDYLQLWLMQLWLKESISHRCMQLWLKESFSHRCIQLWLKEISGNLIRSVIRYEVLNMIRGTLFIRRYETRFGGGLPTTMANATKAKRILVKRYLPVEVYYNEYRKVLGDCAIRRQTSVRQLLGAAPHSMYIHENQICCGVDGGFSILLAIVALAIVGMATYQLLRRREEEETYMYRRFVTFRLVPVWDEPDIVRPQSLVQCTVRHTLL